MKLPEFIAYARKFCVALAAALGVLVIALSDNNVTPTEWLQVAVAFLSAAGVYVVKNEQLR